MAAVAVRAATAGKLSLDEPLGFYRDFLGEAPLVALSDPFASAPHWTGPGFAVFLSDVAAGRAARHFPKKLGKGVADAAHHVKQLLRQARLAAHSCAKPGLHFSIQSVAYSKIKESVIDCDLHIWWSMRASRPPLALTHSALVVPRLLPLAAKGPIQAALNIVRLLANGVCTTKRMHRIAVTPCAFGCLLPAAEDSLEHYLSCDILLPLLNSEFGSPPLTPNSTAAEVLSLDGPGPFEPYRIAAFVDVVPVSYTHLTLPTSDLV